MQQAVRTEHPLGRHDVEDFVSKTRIETAGIDERSVSSLLIQPDKKTTLDYSGVPLLRSETSAASTLRHELSSSEHDIIEEHNELSDTSASLEDHEGGCLLKGEAAVARDVKHEEDACAGEGEASAAAGSAEAGKLIADGGKGDGDAQAVGGESEKQCRICHSCDVGEFISPCLCKGSGRWVHRKCLQEWRVKSSRPDSYHTCELCQHQYTVTCAGWAQALCHDVVQIALTTLLLLAAIAAGAVVWEVLARLFVANESQDNFRFAIRVMGQDIGFVFGGVIMAKIGVIILQLFKHDTPEVQNMVGFLAFIVFLVQSRVFAPSSPIPSNSSSSALHFEACEAEEGGRLEHEAVTEAGIHIIQRYAPHYFLAVYTATTFRWCFSIVSRMAVWAQRTATTVESFRA
eukprot:CAMPEP_0181316530 /NCGR_PEP_ID=MMETSP1101-20121128/15945_1 /TAXON_ID=46948 /ORGANISM="Rhodomonas abbreviata, Strain Caron Lab Isolate" /LENGTH=402 /DNA_ID=CAMNT_0023423785 /DNA_START=174 /DNA_END=1382 /DNA_ORIENTATION=-